MKFLTDGQIRKEAGVNETNPYTFSNTKHSMSHARGWHYINDMLVCLSRKGAINATKNRHHVAFLLSKLQLSEKKKYLIFKACVLFFIKILFFHQMIGLQKLWKMFFFSSKKLYLFSRYSNFCNFFPSFLQFPDSKGQMEVE